LRALAAGLRWLIPPLVLLVLNGGALAAYYLVFSGRAQERVDRFDRLTSTRQELLGEKERLERAVQGLESTDRALADFYGKRLGTEKERFTRIVAEIRDLSRTAGLDPTTINYQMEPIEEQGVVQRSLTFTVSGRYLDLRRLINLLELSGSFITLDRVSLSEGSQGAQLRIALQMSILFAEEAGGVGVEEEGSAS
jgi:hypothetical protein